MAVASVISVSWIFLFLAGGAVGMPAMGAPLPLDPVLSSVAPEECLWYSSYAGIGDADPNSTNDTEQLFAEPQVQRFVAELESQVMAALRRAGGPSREQRVLAAQAPTLLKALFTRPAAMFVESIVPGPAGGVQAEAAVVLNAGGSREELAAALNEIRILAAEKGHPTMAESLGGVDWQRLHLPPQAPPVRIGWKDNYLIVAVGESTPSKIVERMTGDAPEWLARLRAEHPIERELTLGYIDVARIMDKIKPLIADKPNAWAAIDKLGLMSIRALHGVSGYDAQGCTSTMHIATDGQRPGVLGFLPHEPLSADDLSIVPKNALLAVAKRADLGAIVQHAVDLGSQFDPIAKENYERAVWEVETALGLRLRDDVFGALGDVWVFYLPGGDVWSSWLNAGAAVRVKDAPKLRTALGKIMEMAKAEMSRNSPGVSIGQSEVGGHTVYFLQFSGEPVPVAPSWCVTDDWVIFGLMPQAVQAAIGRQKADSLAVDPALAELWSGDAPPAGIAYQDTPRLVQSAYPLLQVALQMASGPLRRQGFEVDVTALPAAETVVKHLRPSITTWRHAEDGFHLTSRGTLPVGGNAVGAAPVLVALLLPAVQSARTAAREAQEMNGLRQLALAFHNYTDAHNRFPTDIYSADGKPLLSWRVRLLPYMEANQLYGQFNLEEPWDSEHNRALLEQMPALFQSVSVPLPPGKTRFVALKGAGTIFPGNEELKFQHVTDGTSMTLMFLEASPEAAVEWTRPADIEYDATKPFAGLAQPSGQFLAAYVDGSVRRLSLGLPAETMRALVSRAGDEPIEYDSLDVPPAPQLHREEAQAAPAPAEADFPQP